VKQRCQRPKIFGAEAFPQALSLNRPLDQNRVDSIPRRSFSQGKQVDAMGVVRLLKEQQPDI